MKCETISNILIDGKADLEITVNGWVKNKRSSKAFSFIELNDGSCRKNLQIIADVGIAGYENINDITAGSSVRIHGILVTSQGKNQGIELHAKEIFLYGSCDPEKYPIQRKKTSDEFLRTVAHLRPRTNKYGAMLRIRSELSHAIHSFFREEGFFYVHTPILTASDCEGAGEMFQVTNFDLDNIPKDEKGSIDY